MESLAELVIELLSSQVGLGLVAAVALVTAVLVSGLAASVIEFSEVVRFRRDSPYLEPRVRTVSRRSRGSVDRAIATVGSVVVDG